MDLKGKLGQSSVNGFLNNSSSVKSSPLPDIRDLKQTDEAAEGRRSTGKFFSEGLKAK